MREIGHVIGGKRFAGLFERTCDVCQTVTDGVAAQPALAATNPQRRARAPMRFVELVNADMGERAALPAREHGKTTPDVKGDIQRGVEAAEFACGDLHSMKGEYIEDADTVDIGFVGSSDAVHHVYRCIFATVERAQCFGVAKNHMIVMPDADVDRSVDALIGAGYGAVCERCITISVAVPVGEAAAETLMKKRVPRVEGLRIGPSADPSADDRPLVTRQARDKVGVAVGAREGATFAVDGRGVTMQGCEYGFHLGGRLFDHATAAMRIDMAEIFGPALSAMHADRHDEALSRLTRHQYGHGIAIHARDGDAACDFAVKLQVGMAGINVSVPVSLVCHFFGGWKRSVFGDLDQYGPDSVRLYTKVVTSRWPSGSKDGAAFSIPTIH